MADGNGIDPGERAAAERFSVAASALLDRITTGERFGETYGGARNVYTALGWKQDLGYADFYRKYLRQDIAGRVIDLPVDASWREGFQIHDREPQVQGDSPFEKAWLKLEKRFRLISALRCLDRMSGIGEYAVLFLGFRGQNPAAPLIRAGPTDLLHTTVFSQPSAEIGRLGQDPGNERFGLPEAYSLSALDPTMSRKSGRIGSSRKIEAHWSRVIHAAESVEDTRIYGRPKLQRIYNLLDSLLLVVGGSAEAFWRGARPRYHMNVDKEFAGQMDQAVQNADGQSVTQRQYMAEEIAKLLHGLQDFIRTTGTEVQQFATVFADPRGAAEVLIDLAAAASGIPKRVLLGSERGELASSQDQIEWANRIHERQHDHLEPNLVRVAIDRFIDIGMLPEPIGGEYIVVWPELTEPHAAEKAALAERITNAEARHAQATMLGESIVTGNELRSVLGFEPIPELADLPEKDQPPDLPQDVVPGDGPNQPPPRSAGGPTVNLGLADVVRAISAVRDSTFLASTRSRVLAAVSDLMTRTARRLGIEEPDVATISARRFMTDYGAERVHWIGDETRDLLAKTLEEGFRAGETQAQMARRVRIYFRQASAGRARVIAATEAHNAASFGTLEGMRAAGAALKGWRSQRDNVVRETHLQLDGQIVPIGDPFTIPSTGLTADRPGGFGVASEDIGCRCEIVAADQPAVFQAAAAEGEFAKRLSVHEKRVLAGVRQAFREQQAAVIAALEAS